jgi:RND superfamily putative drug exporter
MQKETQAMSQTKINTPSGPRRGALAQLADLAYRRRGRVIAAWVAALAAVIALGAQVGGTYHADYTTPGSDSAAAASLIERGFRTGAPDTIDVVWRSQRGAADPAARARVDRFLAQASRLKGIAGSLPTRVSSDGRIAISSLQLARKPWDVPVSTGKRLIEQARAASGNGLEIELAGGPIMSAEGGQSPQGVGFFVAAIVLLIAFGSLVAAGLPLATALFGLGISSSLILVLALAIDVPDWAPAVAGLIGIGVGIDYALLVLTRFRFALSQGNDPRQAVVEAVSTAGRSVLLAGSTVVISLLGLFLVGVSYLHGVALSASLAVLVVMLAAVCCCLPCSHSRDSGLIGCVSPVFTAARTWSRPPRRRDGRASSSAIPGARCSRGRPCCSPSPRRRSGCGWASPTLATTQRERQPARPSISPDRVSGRVPTAPC